MPIAGPFIFDPDRDELPAIDPEAWELTWRGEALHRPTRCEFRTWVTAEGAISTTLELCNPRTLPPAYQLPELARAAAVAAFFMEAEAAEWADCDAQNHAERVAPWV